MQGIKFNTQGVKDINNGLKTQTRRPIKEVNENIMTGTPRLHPQTVIVLFSKYKVGETVFIEEEVFNDGDVIFYRDTNENLLKDEFWSFTTAKTARTFLKIKTIRVERLQDISEEDCIKEGIKNVTNYDGYELRCKRNTFRVDNTCYSSAQYCFGKGIWNKIYDKNTYLYEDNPYVFVYEFELV